MSAIAARRSTMPCSLGSSSGPTTLAPVVMRTSLSEPKYWKAARMTPITTMNIGWMPAQKRRPAKAM